MKDTYMDYLLAIEPLKNIDTPIPLRLISLHLRLESFVLLQANGHSLALLFLKFLDHKVSELLVGHIDVHIVDDLVEITGLQSVIEFHLGSI